MLSVRRISRSNLPQYASTVQRLHTSTILNGSSDSSSSDSDKETAKKSKPIQKKDTESPCFVETSQRLSSLLEKMIKEPKVASKLDLSVPPKKKKEITQRKPKELPYEEKIINAAKDAATLLGGDVEKTQSDLLDKLLASKENGSQKQENGNEKQSPRSLSELLTGMKIDRTHSSKSSRTTARYSVVQQLSNKLKNFEPSKFKKTKYVSGRQSDYLEPCNLYKVGELNLFKILEPKASSANVRELETWKMLEMKEFKLALTHPPANIFQEMIRWTEEGKLWKFPIDNEQGMEEEQSIHFSEHVFMERHLKDWCPKRGPIRHFMELVCVGLSKNPYMTVNEKKEHIAWYREYFGTKQALLTEIGAIDTEIPLKPKEIEA